MEGRRKEEGRKEGRKRKKEKEKRKKKGKKKKGQKEMIREGALHLPTATRAEWDRGEQ